MAMCVRLTSASGAEDEQRRSSAMISKVRTPGEGVLIRPREDTVKGIDRRIRRHRLTPAMISR